MNEGYASDTPFRSVTSVHSPRLVTERTGVQIRRPFPEEGSSFLDPFVLLDDFFVSPPGGFPYHPHSGFEKVTYLLHGNLVHKDSLGHDTVLNQGGAHLLNAGKLIYHSELPFPSPLSLDATEGNVTRGIQLWVNLPQPLKSSSPSFQSVAADEFPVNYPQENVRVTTVIGEPSPLVCHADVVLWEVQFTMCSTIKCSTIVLPLPSYETSFVYTLSGSGMVEETAVAEGTLVVLSSIGAVTIASHKELRLLVCLGRPLGQLIHLFGSFVE